jgi:hypothetical protein
MYGAEDLSSKKWAWLVSVSAVGLRIITSLNRIKEYEIVTPVSGSQAGLAG